MSSQIARCERARPGTLHARRLRERLELSASLNQSCAQPKGCALHLRGAVDSCACAARGLPTASRLGS
jgi:hypothetical protein